MSRMCFTRSCKICGKPAPNYGSDFCYKCLSKRGVKPIFNGIVPYDDFLEMNLYCCSMACVDQHEPNEDPAEMPVDLSCASGGNSSRCECNTNDNLCEEINLDCKRAFGLMKVLEIAEYAAKKVKEMDDENKRRGRTVETSCKLETHAFSDLWRGNACYEQNCYYRYKAIHARAEIIAERAKKAAERKINASNSAGPSRPS